ncbi:MAG: hypothetical protein L0Z73_00030 [Gammaproteobacteria bacterium]|nr:hypothetical protein [Gammaproteobacteria bacterium]
MNRLLAVKKFALLITVYTLCCLSVVSAGEVEIVKVKAEKQRADWVFHVTLKHGDTSWDHYADAWRVVTGDGKELATRTLHHPHIDEQPFTRSLAGVNIPADTSVVYVEAHDKVHGWSKRRYEVKLR